MQSRKLSFIESFCSTLIGLGVAYLTQVLVFPLFGIHVEHRTHVALVAVFTCVSLVRSYFVRRLFNLWS